ncbi:MAG: hypothetical protein H6978_08695 [Gammaproteobacteria bacterium]|nr:hypothetical protein [Gammaproteobacteria bacterium]
MNNGRTHRIIVGLVCCLGGLLHATTASAHHSAGLVYDVNVQTEIEGVVTRFELGNPHMRIYFTRPGVDDQQWMAEGGSRTVLVRKGWTADTFKPGDRIRLQGSPSRDERPIFHVRNIIRADGSEIFAEDGASPADAEARRQRTRRSE